MTPLSDKLQAERDLAVLRAMRDAAIARKDWSDELQAAFARRVVELTRALGQSQGGKQHQ